MSGGSQGVAMQLLKHLGCFYHVDMWLLGGSSWLLINTYDIL